MVSVDVKYHVYLLTLGWYHQPGRERERGKLGWREGESFTHQSWFYVGAQTYIVMLVAFNQYLCRHDVRMQSPSYTSVTDLQGLAKTAGQ